MRRRTVVGASVGGGIVALNIMAGLAQLDQFEGEYQVIIYGRRVLGPKGYVDRLKKNGAPPTYAKVLGIFTYPGYALGRAAYLISKR